MYGRDNPCVDLTSQSREPREAFYIWYGLAKASDVRRGIRQIIVSIAVRTFLLLSTLLTATHDEPPDAGRLFDRMRIEGGGECGGRGRLSFPIHGPNVDKTLDRDNLCA